MSKNSYRKNTRKKNGHSVGMTIVTVLLVAAVLGGVTTLMKRDNDSLADEETYKTVYLVPGDAWLEDGSSVGAYVWNDLSTKFILGADSDEDGVYEFEISTKYDGVVFVDLKPDTTSLGLSWGNVRAQSEDLELPSDKNVYYHQYASEWSASADKLFEVTTEAVTIGFVSSANWPYVCSSVYAFDKTGTNEPVFIKLESSSEYSYISSEIPAGYTHIIFLDYESEEYFGSWNNVLIQTSDLVIPNGEDTVYDYDNNTWLNPDSLINSQ